jgi:hypothetical protein
MKTKNILKLTTLSPALMIADMAQIGLQKNFLGGCRF